VRARPPAAELAVQAQMLGGRVPPPREDVADRIARANHARVTSARDALVARLQDIAVDRAASYARVGIAQVSTSR
jgi:hypothetical protein